MKAALTAGVGLLAASTVWAGATFWSGYARDPQHTALSTVPSQPLDHIIWQTPVDLFPPYTSGGELLIHYGSAMVSGANTVLVPVKYSLSNSFRVEAHAGSDGTLIWQLATDYLLPASYWTPEFGPALSPDGHLAMPAIGGTLLVADGVDGPSTPTPTRVAFYGISAYNGNPSAFNSDVKICTPITSDAQGDFYFGFQASGSNPLGLTSGVARVAPDGSGSYVTTLAATGSAGMHVPINCAPALSRDGQTVYVAIAGDQSLYPLPASYLVALDATTLATRAQVALMDPVSAQNASLLDPSSAAPMVAPDGRVYYGVFENPYISDRGWLLQFSSGLVPSGPPGGFGWDCTASLVPSSMVPSYGGSSSYLLMCKYNHYAGSGPGGNGVNQIAIVDPNDVRLDTDTGANIMKEVLTIAGVTPDSGNIALYPNAVREWCINTAVVDPATHSVLANSEDGKLYRWDLHGNSFTEVVTLTAGVGEAYTPTLISGDGRVYAINNATLFAVGSTSLAAAPPVSRTSLAAPWPNPSRTETRFAFTLSAGGIARLEVLDVSGRRIATLIDGRTEAGPHEATWSGGDATRGGPGVYFARLTAGGRTLTRRFARLR